MSVNLKRFVDVNIKTHATAKVVGTRDTILLFTAEGSTSDPIDVSSYAQAQTDCAGMTSTLAYLKVYFDNGGINARIIGQTQVNAIDLDSIEDKYIVIAYADSDLNVEVVYNALKTIATSRASSSQVYGSNEKIILARTKLTTDNSSVRNFAVKYSNELGAEMTIAAYLSNINVYGTDCIFDYMFTQEVLVAEDMTDTNYAEMITNNLNGDLTLGGVSRNCGGNNKDGSDLVNAYVLIVLHQTITEVLLNLLTQKIKNASGISKIYAVLAQELNKYLTSGYLSTDKVWSDESLVVTYNNAQYTIIEKGTALSNGYSITILPYMSLTAEDKAAHRTPPIYVVLADQYGIRTITINGEVI